MDAALFYGPNKLRIENVNMPVPSVDSIVLKVLSCSVCSYDVRTYRHGSFKVNPPVILGHEICAETIDTYCGENFSVKANQRVSVYPVIPCLYCWYCKHKKYNLCSNLKELGSSLNGGFAEYISIPKAIFEIGGIVPVLDSTSNEEASLIEPLACCVNGLSQIKNNDFESIIIIGDGPIGLMQLMLLKKQFPDRQITMIGKIRPRLDMARKLGADYIYEIKDEHFFTNPRDHIHGPMENVSPNLIFVSNNDIRSLKVALQLVNKNGNIILFSGVKNPSNMKNHDNDVLIDANFIHYNQVTVTGSFSSNPQNLSEAMELVNSKEINIRNLISNTFSLKNLLEALDTSESLKGLKSIINKFD
jgi:L-iditol 2-dehydrogenase